MIVKMTEMYSTQELQLEEMLDVWSQWLKSGDNVNLGYQREAMEYKILNGTAMKSKESHTYHFTESNLIAERLEAMVVVMHKKHPEWAAAVRARYKHGICSGSTALGRKFGIPARTFEDRVRLGKVYLRGMLDGVQDTSQANHQNVIYFSPRVSPRSRTASF